MRCPHRINYNERLQSLAEDYFYFSLQTVVCTNIKLALVLIKHRYLGRLCYAKVLSRTLVTIEQYRISFNRNIMVVNDHSIRECYLWQLSP